MQQCNVTVRHGGSMMSAVPLTGVTPAEILILRRVHGDDAVIDIRPVKFEKTRIDREWDRLADKYDKASSFTSAPGEAAAPMMQSMFPGAMKRLPLTLEEIGLGHLNSPASIRAAKRSAAAPAPVEVLDDADVFDADAEAEQADAPPADDIIVEDED